MQPKSFFSYRIRAYHAGSVITLIAVCVMWIISSCVCVCQTLGPLSSAWTARFRMKTASDLEALTASLAVSECPLLIDYWKVAPSPQRSSLQPTKSGMERSELLIWILILNFDSELRIPNSSNGDWMLKITNQSEGSKSPNQSRHFEYCSTLLPSLAASALQWLFLRILKW